MSAFLSFVAFYRKANGQTAANKCCSYQGLIYDSITVTKNRLSALLKRHGEQNKMTLAGGDII